ncbi:DUF4041 domain-containing protein [Arthrobacter sp. FW305-BF8]|uniref:DUF4041 domain-containing protein n=1 Tax=Arthrobacter sp. FW305-BF8 TaxID=2879617 RepID=UPI001F1D653A|nr:DUF4041 domain-containing protein [Arthrobacter sp. FW305-BF8]UKA54511.1 DUF4041 domain-containing protein [Arthrobacter sp. FW305-BF8]
MKTVKAGNLATATSRLTKAKAQIERQGTMINLRIDEQYHHLRIQEMVLAAEHLQAVAAEKEMERARREDLREQKKAEAELAAARQKLAKERAMHQATLDALIANGDLEGAERMRAKIAEDELALRTSNGARRTSVPATCTLSPTSVPSESTWSRSA